MMLYRVGLSVDDKLSAQYRGVDSLIRLRAVGRFSVDVDGEMVGSRHQRACLNADLSMGQIGPNMKAVNRLHIIQEPGIHHRSGTADGGQLLSRLEDQFYGSVDLVFSLEQKLGRAQKPGHMVIVSAGMHDVLVF